MPEVALATPLLAARGLGYAPAGAVLLRDVDLEVRAGCATVVIGANGAGKSLLLRLLHGLIRPTAGTVHWQGRPLDRAGRRAQAMVFQRPVMLRRSVAGNLAFALSVAGIRGTARRSRLDEALERARLVPLADRPARVLSGGEQQRLALVRALIARPALLFLDEPTASLDPASTAAIEALIAAAHAEGTAIVLVTHDAGQARRLGQEAVFMDRGRIVETGPVAALLDQPRSAAAQAWRDGRLYLPPEGDPR